MKKIVKISAITVGSLLGLVALALVVASVVLTPERLTRWTREYGTEYLVDGRVNVDLVDLSIWSTFPHAELTVENLNVENLSPKVPAEFRTVAAIERLNGRVNLAALLIGRISVSHVDIDRPCATLWTGADSTATSLSILPPSGNDDEPESDEPLSLPDLRIDRFLITGDARVRYVSEADSLDLALTIRQTRLDADSDGLPQYTVSADSRVGALPFLTDTLTLAIDGSIGWNPSEPLAVELRRMRVNVDSLRTCTSLTADFNAPARIEALDFELLPTPLSRLAALAAQLPQLRGKVPAVEGEASVGLSARLLKPYVLPADSLTTLPDLHAELKIAEAPLEIPDYYLALTRLGLDLVADVSSAGLDASTVDLRSLRVQFPASDFTLEAKARNLESNPAAEGCFRGVVNFSNLNPRLWRLLGMRLRGELDADVDFNLSVADLTPNTFHRARLTGDATLRRFEALMPSDSIAAAATRAHLAFGSDMKLGEGDSLLALTLKVDSAWVAMPELSARLADLRLGFGVTNDAQTADTTKISPMGGGISLRLLRYHSNADSTRATLRDLQGTVALTRFKGDGKLPLLRTAVKARRIAMSDGVSRVSLRGAAIKASAYRTPRAPRRPLTHADSLRRAARRDSMILSRSSAATLDLGVDRTSVALLRRWHVNGSLTAESGAMRSPLFPLRTRMENLNLTVSPDSIMLNSLNVRAGRSDLAIAGQITNIQRALGRRHASAPLQLRLDLLSDTLNINELTRAAFRGAAYQAKADPAAAADADADADIADAEPAADADAEMMAVVIPSNIEAEMNFAASNIIYSTMLLTDFYGTVLIADGAANLSDLHASTDIGSADLNMLYRAPSLSDVSFGMTMDLNRFQIGRVTELMPALDSIMPILNTLGGVVNASVAATTPVDSMLNITFPELKAMVRLSGDSLKVLDEQTFKTISKWLLFHDKKKNMIDHMDVSLAVENNRMTLYPFMFDFDRYRIGVMGGNDLNLNLDYHVSILKSPIPFKFGINVKGTADKMKIRLGRARFKEKMAGKSVELSDTIRVNLAREIRNVFRRGAKKARLAPLDVRRPETLPELSEDTDTVAADEKRYFIEQGLLENPADSAAVKPNEQ